MEKEERRRYIFAQLTSLPNAFQYVEVTKYIEDLESQLKKQKEINKKAIEYINKMFSIKFCREIQQLKDEKQEIDYKNKIINELKDWLKSRWENGSESISFRESFLNTLNKLEKLERGASDDED